MATAPIYCTHKELKRVYPQIDSFDAKTPVYGWSTTTLDSNTYYIAYDTGLMTQLFIDGVSQQSGNQTIGTSATTTVNEEFTVNDTTLTVAAGNTLTDSTYIKIGSEVLGITAISTDNLTVTRGELGTTPSAHANGSSIFKHFQPASNGDNLYDSDNDFIIVKYGSNLNDLLTEAGEDFTDLITQFRTDASRYLDSKLDPNLPREQLKDKSGNFDYMIIRSSALIAAAFLIRANDPTNEVATALMEEAQGNIDALNDGKAALSWQTTRDASRGIIRDVSYTDGSVRPVDTRGVWNGTFDLIRVKIETGGALDGTATYSVWVKNADKLGIQQGNQVVTSEKINGDYQALAGGLQIRFAGESKTSVATATNEWEIEVMGATEHIDASGVKSVNNSRWL
tara:strand:+ start:1737 stop:2924 length:1188 start_codon:yes stop_codon:yes gene_type:complete